MPYNRKDLETYFNDGVKKGMKQGKKDQLARFRVYIQTEESRVERS